MKKYNLLKGDHAVSELIGGMILLAIAVMAFSSIYMYVFPLPIPSAEPHVKLLGYVDDVGNAVIQHMGGESIGAYKIVVRNDSGTLINSQVYQESEDIWKIGECKFPPIESPLIEENDTVRITIYDLDKEGEQQIFDGILNGKTGEGFPTGDAMLISSLRTNTVDEDLICYNYTINPIIDALTYIYNWSIDGNSISNLLMPFDTDSSNVVKDYSGHEKDGTVFGSTWNSNGIVGGAYSFDGDDYISIPYCFDLNYIDEITLEAWINTFSHSEVIASFGNKLWELGISNGALRWSTSADDCDTNTIGVANLADGSWHHVATTYDSSTGECNIYVDGIIDKSENGHNPGEKLGNGETPIGSIGLGVEVVEETIFSTSFETQDEKNNWNEHNVTGEEELWENLRYDNFNYGYGSYSDGGSDCTRVTDYKHEGPYSVRLRDNSYSSHCTLTNGINVHTLEYTSLKIDFWWMWNGDGWGNNANEDWWIRYYDGSSWHTVSDINYPSGLSKDVWYHEIIYINETDYNFPINMKIRFQCDASYDNDRVFIDQVYINATGSNRYDYDFDLLDSGLLSPKSGTYSIGGTGDFDPDYAAFNRSCIDISDYINVNVSVWYSYKSTESEDEIGFYYWNGSDWVVIFEELNPLIGNGNQLPWEHVEVQIPNNIDFLILQFKWSTSSTSEYMAIDDLEIKGLPKSGGCNFSGLIDELHIYNRVLSNEQIYQNYLCTKDGDTSKSVIVSEETNVGESWKCTVTPNDGTLDSEAVESNILNIINYEGG